MNNETQGWNILLSRIEHNINRINARLAELEAQKQAIQRIVTDPEKQTKK